MIIIIDANRVIAAMIKNSVSRKILFNDFFQFISPTDILISIEKYKKDIIDKAKISHDDFDVLLSLILERITILPKEEYAHSLKEAKEIIDDVEDVPFMALALSVINEGIWSHDKHFEKQNKIKIWKTNDLVDFL